MKSGVRQGCILSPIISWSSSTGLSGTLHHINSGVSSGFSSPNFANDLAFLSVKLDHLQETTDRLGSYAKQTGLTMSTTKTQLMTINTTSTTPDTLNSEPLELVEDFTYPGNLISKDNGQNHQTRPG